MPIFVPMITNEKLNKIKADLAVIGTGSKRDLAKYIKVFPSQLTAYLKYGDIPKDRLAGIYEFIKKNKK